MEVSSDSTCITPEGFTSVTLSELNDMGFDSPSEVYEAALDDSTAWPVSTPNGWHYANYFQKLSDPFMKRICCGSRIWRDWPGPMGLACKTWCRRNGSGQPYAMVRDQLRIVRWGFGLNSYGRWAYPRSLTMDWKQEGWFDDGNIQHQVYKVDFTTW
jgi:hypothetical protein